MGIYLNLPRIGERLFKTTPARPFHHPSIALHLRLWSIAIDLYRSYRPCLRNLTIRNPPT